MGRDRKEYYKEYYQKNKDKMNEYNKKRSKENKEEVSEKHKKYYLLHREEILIKNKEYRETYKEEIRIREKKHYEEHKEESHMRYINNIERERERCRKYHEKHPDYRKGKRLELRMKFINMYGGKCVCCGESIYAFLTLGHLKSKPEGANKYSEYVRAVEKYNPDEFAIECWNCNSGKHANGGICPHKEAI